MNAKQLANSRTKKIRQLAEEAKQFHKEAESARAAVEAGVLNALEKAWQCGKRLNRIKQIIGHGNFLRWLESNLPTISVRTAQRYMQIDKASPNATRVSHLKFDSIRKHAFSFIPEKERPKLEDRHKIPRLMHHLTVVNEFFRWKRRRDIGLIEADSKEERRDFKPVFEWMRDNLFSDEP